MKLPVFIFLVSLLSHSFCAPFASTGDGLAPGLNGVSSKLLCDVCSDFVSVLRHLVDTHASEDVIVDVAIDYCKFKKIQDHYICSKIVPEFKVLKYSTSNTLPRLIKISTNDFLKVCLAYDNAMKQMK